MSKELTIADRLSLRSILPQEGDFNNLILSEAIDNKIDFTEKDIKIHDIKQVGNSYTWKKQDVTYKYDFTELETALIKKTLEKLDQEKKLNITAVELYRLFVSA